MNEQHNQPKSDIEIAQAARMRPIVDVGRDKLGIPVLSDVHTAEEATAAGKVLDVLQIPAFLCRQTDLLQAAGRTGKTVNVKKGQFLAPWDMANVVKKLEETGNHSLLLTDRGGTPVGSALPLTERLSGRDDWPFTRQVLSTGRSVVTSLMSDVLTDKPTVMLGYPIRDARGTLAGALGLGIDLARLQTVFANIALPADSVVTVADRSGRILARSRDAEKYIGTSIAGKPIEPESMPRWLEGIDADGVHRIVGNSVGLHPMTVIVSIFVWGLLIGGLLGPILAVPLTATLKVLLARYVWVEAVRRHALREPGLDEVVHR